MLNLDALNEAQRKAVMHGEGPLLVLAGPGSGKTFTTTQRILYLIEVMQVPPEEILVITFTKDAALSMQRRFQEQSNRIYPVNFGTFHSIFYQILRNINTSHSLQILQESRKKNLIFPFVKNTEKTEAYLSAISFYKNTGDKNKTLLKLPEENREDFMRIFQAYERSRRQQNSIDFDDMVYECAEALKKNRKAREYWSRRFSHILIDEFQDINPMQYYVVKILAGSKCNLFAVGDDDQAIYGFRGANPACMQQFVEDYHAEKILLNINYRCYPTIIKASLKVIGENSKRFVKQLEPCMENSRNEEEALQGDTNVVILNSFIEKDEQYAYLTDAVENRNDEDISAVLFRTNMQMQSFAAILNRKGIPYEMKEKAVSIYDHFIVKDIMAYLRIAAGEEKRELYLQILNKPYRMLSRESLWTENGKVSLKTIKEYYEKICSDENHSERFSTFGTDNSTIKKAGAAINILEKQMEYIQKTSLFLGVQYICKVIGYEKYLNMERRKRMGKDERFEEWLQILEWLKQEAKQYDNLQEWMDAQEEYKNRYKKENEEKITQEENAAPKVRLMTVHASKGLEFDRVYIPDCNEKTFPHGSMPDQETCEEERRIFYVAMTRAKKSLELLYLTGTKERPRLPSRFLNPLLD